MDDDSAGPLLGWSLAAGLKQQRIHEMVEFPCEFCFKVVGDSSAGFVTTLLERVGAVLGRTITSEEHSVRESAHGTYASVTLRLWVTSGDEVYSIYAAMGADKRVRYML